MSTITSRNRTKKGLIATALVALCVLACATLSGCGSSSASTTSSNTDKTITVAAVPTPQAEVLNEAVAPLLKEKGYTLEVKEFTDYVQPNTVTEAGEVDANYFQHKPYLDDFNTQQGTHLSGVCSVHFEPFGLYAGKTASLDSLADGATVAIPNDATNEARALLLLQDAGLITLDEAAGISATPADITSNPKNLSFRELEAAVVPTVLADVDIAAINGNYAIASGLEISNALASESADSLAAQTYANLLVVSDDKVDDEKTKVLAEALNSDEVRTFINDTYNGAVLPTF